MKQTVLMAGLCIVLSAGSALALAQDWKAGIASTRITPDVPIHLAGYPNRKTPFENVDADIYAKALVLEDSAGKRGVIVTSDLLFINDEIFASVCDRISERTGLERHQVKLNAAHNHTAPLVSLAPVLSGNLAYGDMTSGDAARVVAYTKELQDKCVALVEQAVADLKPARLSFGTGTVSFPMNRRSGAPGAIGMSPNPQGIVDRSVPVLKVASLDGQLRCVLFGCACHNTTLTPDHNIISGDYAGYAQQDLQNELPGVQAMFMSGCGADANPEPRGSIDQARQHGAKLATEVHRVLEGPLQPVTGSLNTGYEIVELPLMKLDANQLQAFVARGGAPAIMASHMIQFLEQGGTLPETYHTPIAVWTFGESLTLVGLPGEAVAGYADQIRQRLRSQNIWISSYNNDGFGYLPTARIVREGGHEAIGLTIWLWGVDLEDKAGFFTEDVEPTILNAVTRLADNPTASSGRELRRNRIEASGTEQ